jgi:hypothetical protein
MKTLIYMRESKQPFAKLVRDLFIVRMGNLLPSKLSGKIYHMIFLPEEFGGLNLGFKDEVREHFQKSPYPIQCVLQLALATNYGGEPPRRAASLLKDMTKNSGRKGIASSEHEEFVEALTQFIEDGTESDLIPKFKLETMTWWDLKDRFKEVGNSTDILRASEREGICTQKRFVEKAIRPLIFQNLIEDEGDTRVLFNTKSFLERYLKIRERLIRYTAYAGVPDYEIWSDKEILSAKYHINKTIFIDQNSMCESYNPSFGFWMEIPVSELFSWGMPDLIVRDVGGPMKL